MHEIKGLAYVQAFTVDEYEDFLSFSFFLKLKTELDQLNGLIGSTSKKMNTTKIYDEVLLSQLETPLYKIDPYYNQNRA